MSKQNSNSVADLLNKVAKKTDSTKKSKVPIIDDSNFHSEVNDFVIKNREFKNAKTAMELAGEAIMARGSEWYTEQKGNLNSVKYAGTEGNVLVTYKDSFSKITPEIAEDLKKTLKGKFDDYFQEKRTIALKETNDDAIDYLLKTLGEEKFVEIFEVKIDTVVVPDMDKKQFELPDSARSLISQFKPALRAS